MATVFYFAQVRFSGGPNLNASMGSRSGSIPELRIITIERWCRRMPRFRRCRYPGCHAMVQLPNHYCSKHFENEAEYIANRQRWARARGKQYQRKYNTVTRYRNNTKSDQYNFYRTKQWQELRQRTLDRDHYICQYCGQPNSKTVDHVVPIEFDLTSKAIINNLCTICNTCHRLKTQWERSYYGTGQGNRLKTVPAIKNIRRIKELMQDT
jgi:5-methylcytosine-specific restriction endonuclease McrA